MSVARIGGGQSNPTYRLRFAAGEVVLRKQPAGELLPSAHAVDREHRVMAALHTTDVPVPRMLHLCEDRAVIGTLFYVMEALDGRVVHDSSIPGVTPSERAAMYASMNDVLARLHGVDWRAVGLEGFGRSGDYFARQVSRWTRQWHASKTREIPEIDHLVAWLPDNLPAGADETTIVHGDFRLGNLMFHPNEPRVIAILDWELSTLGHPLADLAHNCLLWHATRAMYHGVEDLDQKALGIPSEADYVRRYCERTGRADGLGTFHLAFAMFRFAVIFEGIAQRARIGTAAAADAEQVGRLSVDYARRAFALIAG
jgi:aminoglycoside phosphotransferase (APT) family kinase protein